MIIWKIDLSFSTIIIRLRTCRHGAGLDRAARVMKGEERPLERWPNLRRFMKMMNARPAVDRAHAIVNGHVFKTVMDEDARQAMYPTSLSTVSKGTVS